MLRFGPAAGPVVIAALPLFEEANRTRAFTVAILRALAGRGIAGALPDLPGQGESLVPTEDARLDDLRAAYAAAVVTFAGRPCYSLAIRSGALLDSDAPLAGRWHLAPQTGARLCRALARIKALEGPEHRTAPAGTDFSLIAGNVIAHALLGQLADATPRPARVVRLTGDAAPADAVIDGPPLWRRAEPGNDTTLVATVTDDIARWIATCAG